MPRMSAPAGSARLASSVLVVLAVLAFAGCTTAPSTDMAGTPRVVRKALLTLRDRALEDLYKAYPTAREEIRASQGYAVFDPDGDEVPSPDAVRTRGVLTEMASGRMHAMTMLRSGVGAGKNFRSRRQVVVLRSPDVFVRFRDEGIDALPVDASDASRAIIAKPNPDVTIYDLTEQGVVVHSNWGAVRYEPDGKP